jgi:2-dehydropantoate 2-reductase
VSAAAVSGPVLIWGAGAIGGTIGACLVRAGHEVVFVDIVPEHVEAIRGTGLELVGPLGGFKATASAFTPETLKGRFTRTMLCVKAHHTAGAIRALAPHLTDDGHVVSAQNGLNEIEISAVVGAERTIGSFVNFGADYLSPGVVTYAGRGAVVLGELDGRMTPRLQAIHELFLDFDRDAIATDNIWGYLWGKLGYGALLFVTALTNESIAEALDDRRHRRLYQEVGGEVMAVAAARKVRPEGFNGFVPEAFRPGADPALIERSFAEMVAHNRASAKSHSGIWRDLAIRKRKTEIDAQIGVIARLGAEVGIDTPKILRLVELIHEVEDGRRPLDRANLDAVGVKG